jgi:hypothetical protein
MTRSAPARSSTQLSSVEGPRRLEFYHQALCVARMSLRAEMLQATAKPVHCLCGNRQAFLISLDDFVDGRAHVGLSGFAIAGKIIEGLSHAGQRDPSRSFSFAFLTPSFGLVEAPSSQRSTCIIVIACFAAGSRTSMSSTVAGPTCSIHGSPLNVRTPRTAASKSDSACTSTVCRIPRTSANETAQIRSGTGWIVAYSLFVLPAAAERYPSARLA